MDPFGAVLALFAFDLAVGVLYKFLGEYSDYPYLQDLYKYEQGEIYWFEVRKSDNELNKQLDECKRVSEKSAAFKQMLCSIESAKKITYYKGVEAVKKAFCFLYDSQTWISIFLVVIAILIMLYMINWRQDCMRQMKNLGEKKKESVIAHGSLADLYTKSSSKHLREDKSLKAAKVDKSMKMVIKMQKHGEKEKEEEKYEVVLGKTLSTADEDEKCSPIRNPVGIQDVVFIADDLEPQQEWQNSSENL